MVMGRVKHTIEGYTPHELSNLFVSFYPIGTTVRTDEYKTRPRIGVVGMYDSNGVLYELVNGKKSPVPGVNLWASMGERVEPSGWTWRASWTFDIEPVNFTLRENETVDLSVVIMENVPANNGELFRDVAQQVKKDSERAVKSADKAALESSSAKQSKEAAARSAKESSSSATISVNAANKATAAKVAAETASNQAIIAANTSLSLSGEFNSLAESARLSENSASAYAQRSETAASTTINSQLAAKVSQDAAKVSETNSATKATESAGSAATATSKASEASASAASAANSAADAAASAASLKMASGQVVITAAAGSTTTPVTLPAGKFTAAPMVVIALTGTSGSLSSLVGSVTALSNTSFSIVMRNSSTSTITVTVCWIAHQS